MMRRLRTRALSTPLRLLAALALLTSGAVLAHAHLHESTPAANSAATEAFDAVSLTFSEPVETLFSIFKVYRLEADDVDMSEANAWQRLNGLAGALMSEVLTTNDEGADARVDTGLLETEPTTAEVTIGVQPDLAPGKYVVMWSVLSIDTHTTQEFFVFSYEPAAD